MARPALTARGQQVRVAVALPALAAIFLLGQGVLDRHGWRLDLTPERRYTLSDHGERVLATLPADVRILAFLRSQDPRNLAIRDLLRQLEQRSPRIRVETLDVNRSPSLAREYEVESYGAVVVESGGRRRVVTSPREEVMIAAMLQVTRQERKTIGWLMGHGEGDLADTNRHRGYSTARRVLEEEYYEVVPVSLVGGEVPLGTVTLVIAGPAKDLLPEELAALDRYLQRPGQVFVLVDPGQAPALAGLLERYHLRVGRDLVVDPDERLYGGEYLTMQLRFDAEAHPILAPLTAPPLFSRTRSVELTTAPGHDFAGLVFLRTGEQSWTTTDVMAGRAPEPTFVPGRDRRGPIGVGAEIAFRTPEPPGAEPRQGRLVVYGNAQFANNFFIELLGNKDLFVNSVAWLARDAESIGHRTPRQVPGVNQFFVSEEDGARLFWWSALVLPLGFALVGIALVIRRRRS
ncbi:MAG: GldG family protein [Candidatus Binatia bacterium]